MGVGVLVAVGVGVAVAVGAGVSVGTAVAVGVGKGTSALAGSLTTKASLQVEGPPIPLHVPPPKVVWNAPAVVGKSEEPVRPVT